MKLKLESQITISIVETPMRLLKSTLDGGKAKLTAETRNRVSKNSSSHLEAALTTETPL